MPTYFQRSAQPPGHDGQCRIHEDHLEEEQDHDTDVIGRAAQEEAHASRTIPKSYRTN